VLLAARIMAWACALPLLKQVIPLQTLVLVVRRPSGDVARDATREDQVLTFARWACRITRPSSGGNCLERGLIGYRYLGAINADPTLVVGMGRADGGQVRGHAWIVIDGRPVGETPALTTEYTPMVAFGPDGAPLRDRSQPLSHFD
jgi:hypothetical protein